jgi:hypothetical protein
MPGYFERHCVKFTFRGFSEEIPPLGLIFLEPEELYSWF